MPDVETPPVETPPVETPPVETPPVETPPVVPEAPPLVAVPDWLSEHEFADDSERNILTRYETEADARKALVEAQKSIRSGFKMPDKLSDEQFAEIQTIVNKKNEVPDTAGQYTLTKPEEIAEGLDFSDEMKVDLQEWARSSNTGQKGLQGLYEVALRGMQRAQTTIDAATKESFESDAKKTSELMAKYWGPGESERVKESLPEFIKGTARRGRDRDYNWEAEVESLDARLTSTGLKNDPLLSKLLGDGARMWTILESNPTLLTKIPGNIKLTQEAEKERLYPSTPVELGGGQKG